MSFQELTGSLASGGRFRLVGQLLEITGPDGNLLATFDLNTVSSVQRADKVVTLSRYSEGNVTIITSSDDDASMLDHNVRAVLASRGSAAPQQAQPTPPPPSPPQQQQPPAAVPPPVAPTPQTPQPPPAQPYQQPPASQPPPAQQPYPGQIQQPAPQGQYRGPATPGQSGQPAHQPPQQYSVPAGGVAAGAAGGAGVEPPAEAKSNRTKYLLFGGIGCAALVVIGCAAILVAAVLLDDNNDPTPVAGSNATAVQSTASTDSSNSQVSGETFRVSDVDITLVGTREGENEVFAADEGNIYIVAEYQVSNVSSEPYTLSTLLQFDMIDADGTEHPISIFPEMTGTLDGDIPAGQSVTGEVGFEVPQGKGPYTIRFSEFLSEDSAEWVVQQP